MNVAYSPRVLIYYYSIGRKHHMFFLSREKENIFSRTLIAAEAEASPLKVSTSSPSSQDIIHKVFSHTPITAISLMSNYTITCPF